MSLKLKHSNLRREAIGDIVNFKRGYDLPSYNRIDGVYPIISSGGISGYHNEFKADGEGLVTGRYGTLGKMYYVNGKYWPHNTALYATNFKGNYPKYVYFLMKWLGNLQPADKSTVPGINRNDLHDIRVPFIEKHEQKPVADLLFGIEEKIELNNKINAELEGLAKLVYDYWFVQFDFPNGEGKPYRQSGGKMRYDEVLRREVPEGWEVKELEELSATIARGISPAYLEKGGICVLNQKCIREKSVLFENGRRHDNLAKSAASKLVEIGDVLVNSTGEGTLGRVAVVRWLAEPIVTVDSHVTIIRPDTTKVNKTYLALSVTERQNELAKLGEGSTGQTELSRKKLCGLKMLVPNAQVQNSFEVIILPLIQKMALNEQENRHLSELRDWLLPLLMNGQVVVG
jgi:type I restriction enzyme S subunit